MHICVMKKCKAFNVKAGGIRRIRQNLKERHWNISGVCSLYCLFVEYFYAMNRDVLVTCVLNA
jgi:hypothetical protein